MKAPIQKYARPALLLTILVLFVCAASSFIDPAHAIITEGFYYCSVFTTHPGCTGWRNIPVMDNFWFCEYVDLPTMCKYKPDPEKQVFPQLEYHLPNEKNNPQNHQEFLKNRNMNDSNYKTSFESTLFFHRTDLSRINLDRISPFNTTAAHIDLDNSVVNNTVVADDKNNGIPVFDTDGNLVRLTIFSYNGNNDTIKHTDNYVKCIKDQDYTVPHLNLTFHNNLRYVSDYDHGRILVFDLNQ